MITQDSVCEIPALLGGTPAVTATPEDLFRWPILTEEDEAAVLDVMRHGNLSGIDVTLEFEKEFAAWLGTEYALGFNNGTASLLAAMFAVGIGSGDEIICPATTYWASALPVYGLGGTAVFADIDPQTLCLDISTLEQHISARTKAIVVVHYLGHPVEMDAVMEVARRHKLKVIEDVSHAHGGCYRGRRLGTIGDVGCFSLMAGKPLAVGEAGMLVTNDRALRDRAIAFGHYERFSTHFVESEELIRSAGLPFGGCKNRMHQLSAAVGRVQLRHYEARSKEIRKAMNRFWDLLEDVPGLRPHRVAESSGSTMGGWYSPHGHYVAEELGGLSITRFCEAVRAEGVASCSPGCNMPLHRHPLFTETDIYGEGQPTRIARSSRDLRQPVGSLPVAESIMPKVFTIPWFKHDRPEVIAEYASAFRKTAAAAESLRDGDSGDPANIGSWNFFKSWR